MCNYHTTLIKLEVILMTTGQLITLLIFYSCSGHGDDDNATNVIASSNTRQSKKTWPWIVLRGLKILRPFLQFGCFCAALFISLTRIMDLRHHPGDVVTGILVGSFFAAIILLFVADIFKGPRGQKYVKVGLQDDIEMEANASSNNHNVFNLPDQN